jgi:predicted O-linked N-acetylglucosamine transferase (SPINDLY family)
MTTNDDTVSAAQKLLTSGDRDGALELLQAVLAREPRHAAANNLAGFVALQQGRPDDAEARFRVAIDSDPQNSVYRDNIALARSLRQPSVNSGSLRAALTANPKQPEAWRKLAQAEAADRRVDNAISVLYEGLSHCPEQADLLHALGNYLHYAGRLTQAATHYLHCIRVAPQREDARIDLSQVYLRLLDGDLAESAARGAVACAPASARAAVNLGSVLYQRNRFTEALEQLERGRAMAPDNARTYNQLGMVHAALGDINQALASYRHSAQLNPDYHTTRTNLMLTLLYSDKTSGQAIYQEACAYGKRFLPGGPVTHANTRDPGRRLRIGFVSGDFRRHVVGLFLLPLFADRDRGQSEYFCYSLIDAPDPFTQMLSQHADQWIDSRGLDDAQLVARIRNDAIDILIDLSGHTSDNRLQMFARRPAPVQATWLGFPGTTGAPGIDYRLTDDILDPPGSESESTETPVRLATGFFCYQPLPEWGGLLQVGPLPAARNGHITFGAFNNLAKISPACIDSWAGILRQVPGSMLVSRAKPFALAAERERFAQHFAQRGIDPARINPLPYLPDPARHLEVYHDIDIHLDSHPYTGGTTTCDALWMGVPVVTLSGDRPSARLGATVLRRLGLEHLVAADAEDYVRIAVALAQDQLPLAGMRQQMRARFMASPLHGAKAFACEFDRACRSIWRLWCSQTG